jgi:ubiquitin-activating enzyme E1 C
VSYERNPQCPVCSPGIELVAPADSSLQQVIDCMLAHAVLGKMVAHPSVSHGNTRLYSRGVFEAQTKANLQRPIAQLLEGATTALLTVNDKKLSAPLRVRLRLQ